MAKRKSWREKLDHSQGLPRIFEIPERAVSRYGSGTMVVPLPRDVDAIMRQVAPGDTITIREIRERVARQYGATTGCPITCGIFAWIAAHAAEEERAAGRSDITPWWRTLKSGGELNPKYPGGVARQTKLLREEGQIVRQQGKCWFASQPAAPTGEGAEPRSAAGVRESSPSRKTLRRTGAASRGSRRPGRPRA